MIFAQEVYTMKEIDLYAEQIIKSLNDLVNKNYKNRKEFIKIEREGNVIKFCFDKKIYYKIYIKINEYIEKKTAGLKYVGIYDSKFRYENGISCIRGYDENVIKFELVKTIIINDNFKIIYGGKTDITFIVNNNQGQYNFFNWKLLNADKEMELNRNIISIYYMHERVKQNILVEYFYKTFEDYFSEDIISYIRLLEQDKYTYIKEGIPDRYKELTVEFNKRLREVLNNINNLIESGLQ